MDAGEAQDWVRLERPDQGGEWARIVMQREPVNSMNYGTLLLAAAWNTCFASCNEGNEPAEAGRHTCNGHVAA